MDTVIIRCHGELNDFLPRAQRHVAVAVPCAGHESVKNVVEALGVPHPEIEALLANDAPVDLGYLVSPGDTIDAYPRSLRPATALPLRPPLAHMRFVLDTHLGRLAAYLRMLGFDTLYRNDYDDPELAQVAHDDERLLLTRDIGLLKRSLVVHGYFVRETDPEQQLAEIACRYALHQSANLFQRCIRCNGTTHEVAKADVAHLLEPRTRDFYHVFRQCQSCQRVYWQGSHYEHMQQVAERALQRATECANE